MARQQRPELFHLQGSCPCQGHPGGPQSAEYGHPPAAFPQPRPGPSAPSRPGPRSPGRPGRTARFRARTCGRPELLRFAGCGQATPRLRPGDLPRGPGRPARPRRSRRRLPGRRPSPAARPPAMPRSWGTWPELPGLRTSAGLPWRNCADIADQCLQRIAAIHQGEAQVAAVSGRLAIQMKTLPRDPGIIRTPRAPRTGRAPPPGRAARARSARCRPGHAGRPAPRLRRAPGRAGRPGRTGP
jgi:hypothetical protein